MTIESITLEGQYVRLEPLTESHHAGMCRVSLDPELWRLIPYRMTTPEEVMVYIRSRQAALAAGDELGFATVERTSGLVVGSTRFLNMDVANRRVEIGGTWIAKPWQRTAINTEAKYLMLRHAFETWQCIRVELKTDALNRQSRDAILRIGATEEGTLRQHMVTWSGRVRDSVYFSILDSEWPEVKAALVKKLECGEQRAAPATPEATPP